MAYMIGDAHGGGAGGGGGLGGAVGGGGGSTGGGSDGGIGSGSGSGSGGGAGGAALPANPAASKDDGSHERARLWLLLHPSASHALLAALADACVELLVGQWAAGASVLQVFESAAGELPPRLFEDFALPYMVRVAAGVRARTPPVSEGGPPLIAFPRNAHQAGVLEALCASPFDAISLDWLTEPAAACERVAGACRALGVPRKALQGNLDPALLHLPPAALVAETARMLRGFGDHPLVANLGHGMHPSHAPARLALYFEAVHALSAAARSGEGAEAEAEIEAAVAARPPRMVVPAEFVAAEAAAAAR